MDRRTFFNALKILGLGLAGAGAGLGIYVKPRISKAPSGEDLERIAKSPHFKNGHFECIEPLEILNKKEGVLRAWWKYFTEDKGVAVPKFPLPATKMPYQNMRDFSVAWLGHSSYFARFGGVSVLIDPVFSDFAAPVWFANRAFKGTSIFGAEDFGDFDILIITHDHYDHLDYVTIKALNGRFESVLCGLGVGGYLKDWGVEVAKIREFDWYESAEIAGLTITFLPAQHFSGRFLNRNVTLWGGFALQKGAKSLYISGDSGYGKIFAEFGERFGDFDLALLDCGQYNPAWSGVHANPAQVDKIAREIRAKRIIAGHNGRFCLSSHAWDEPYRAMSELAKGGNYEILTPQIGEICEIYGENHTYKWWEGVG